MCNLLLEPLSVYVSLGRTVVVRSKLQDKPYCETTKGVASWRNLLSKFIPTDIKDLFSSPKWSQSNPKVPRPSIGFKPTGSDPCMYIHGSCEDYAMMTFLTDESSTTLTRLKAELIQQFDIADMEECKMVDTPGVPAQELIYKTSRSDTDWIL